MKVVSTFIMTAKRKKYSNTDPILLSIFKGWNTGFLSKEAQDYFGELATWNLKTHTIFYVWNAIPTYLNDLKKHYEDDINNLNILLIYGLVKNSIEKELEILNIDSNSLEIDFDKLLFENLALTLNKLSIYKEDEKTKELKFNLDKYWNKSFKNIYDQMDHSIPYLNNKVAEKLSGIQIDKLNVNELVNKNDLKNEINNWSNQYEKTCSDIGGFDFKNLKEVIIEYDWDTRFLWLVSHSKIINSEINLIEIYEGSIYREYGKLVKITFSILEKINISKYEAVKNIPNLFIRLYDYLILGMGAKFYHDANDLNISQKKILYSSIASDLLLKPNKGNTLNHSLFSALGITFKCFYHENGLKKANSGDLKGAIEDFSKSIAAHPNQLISHHDRALARKLSKDYEGAIEDYTRVIKLNNELKGEDDEWIENIYLERGYCRFLAQDDKGAIEDYTKVIEYNPKSYIGYGRRGIVHDFIENFEDAISDFTNALDFYNKNEKYELEEINLYIKRGDSKFAKEDFEGARFDTNEAIQINNEKKLLDRYKVSELYVKLGCINTCLHRKDEALLCFSKAIELDPKSLSAYSFKAQYLYSTFKDEEKALNECEKAINLNIDDDPLILSILELRSSINNENNNHQEELKDINRMINLHQIFFPNDESKNRQLGQYFVYKAIAKLAINKYDKTIMHDFNKAAELGDEYAKQVVNDYTQQVNNKINEE